jgi:hypothetical protein
MVQPSTAISAPFGTALHQVMQQIIMLKVVVLTTIELVVWYHASNLLSPLQDCARHACFVCVRIDMSAITTFALFQGLVAWRCICESLSFACTDRAVVGGCPLPSACFEEALLLVELWLSSQMQVQILPAFVAGILYSSVLRVQVPSAAAVRACCIPLCALLCMFVLQFIIAQALGQCSHKCMMLLSAGCVFDWCSYAACMAVRLL